MATRTLRRTVATATLAGFATALAPMAVSLAAPAAFAASGITTDPKPDSSGVVAATRPVIKATFNAAPASGNIKLTAEGGDGTNLCAASVINGSTVQCQPDNALDKTKTYDAVGTAKDSSGTSAKTSTLKFTVDYPVLDPANSSPVPNGSFASGTESITTAFDEAIAPTDSKNPNSSFQLFEVNADGTRGASLPGTVTFNQQPVVGGSDDTVTFDPAPTLANGKYEAVIRVIGSAPTAVGNADYNVFITNTPPFNLNLPVPNYNGKPYANTSNNTAFPFSGNAAPGLTVTVSLTDSMDPNPLSNSYSDSTTVQPCASAPSCPWTVPLDISGFTSPQNNVTWTAQASDGNTSTGTANGPTFNVDYSAPATVSVRANTPTISADSKTVTVNATDTDTDVASYKVTIADPDGNSLVKTFNATNHNLPDTPIDVTTLDDGTLHINIQAVDNVGNVSPATDFTVTKNVGLLPNLGTSVLSSDSGDTTFQSAETQSVQSPTAVKLSFTQSIKESWTDNSNPLQPKAHHSSLCIASTNGNCLFSAAPTVDPNDDHTLVIQVKNDVPDATYEIQTLTYSKGNCADISPGGNPSTHTCEQFPSNGVAGVVNDPNTGQPFKFTVDSSPPTVSIDSFTHPVTAQNEKSASFSGTVTKSVSSVQLLIRSSGSTTTKLLFNATITQPTNTSDPKATWAVGPVDLSPLPDGTLTIKATAKKSSGLSGTDTVHATMKAHQAQLTEKVNKGKVTFGHSVKVSGLLTAEGGTPITGENVSVKPKYTNGHSGKAVTTVTDSSGHYSAIITPQHNATFYATYPGSPQHDGVTVHTAKTGVRFAVKFSSPKQGASASSPVKVAGSVKPNHAGAKVTFYRHTSSGNVVVGHAKLNKKSRFSASLSLPTGKDKIFAKVSGTKANLAGKSSLLTIHVS